MSIGHTELILSVIQYAIQAYQKGDLPELLEMGFEAETLHALTECSATQHHMLATMRGHFADIEIDNDSLRRALQLIRLRQQEIIDQDELLRAGAPLALTKHLFGATQTDHSQRRKLLGITDQTHGRPHNLDEAQTKITWDTWHATEDQPDVARWLAIARQGIPLNSAYAAICEWQKAEEKEVVEEQTEPQGD
ncbi:MAG: DUF2857 domain-containing protein [Gammaproteobacteria bacterium]|nr:DUF2857 domain-containing protein [Gammaproteobacteria bacterium]